MCSDCCQMALCCVCWGNTWECWGKHSIPLNAFLSDGWAFFAGVKRRSPHRDVWLNYRLAMNPVGTFLNNQHRYQTHLIALVSWAISMLCLWRLCQKVWITFSSSNSCGMRAVGGQNNDSEHKEECHNNTYHLFWLVESPEIFNVSNSTTLIFLDHL